MGHSLAGGEQHAPSKRPERFNIKLPNAMRTKFTEPYNEFLLGLLQTSIHITQLPDLSNYWQRIHSVSGSSGPRWTLWLSRAQRQLFFERKECLGQLLTHAEFLEMLLVLRELIECGSCPAHAADVTDELPVELSQILTRAYPSEKSKSDGPAASGEVFTTVSELFGTPLPPPIAEASIQVQSADPLFDDWSSLNPLEPLDYLLENTLQAGHVLRSTSCFEITSSTEQQVLSEISTEKQALNEISTTAPFSSSLICVDGLKQDIPSPLLGQLEPEPVLLQAPSHATPHVSLSVTRSRPSLSLNTLQTQPRSIRSSRHSSSNQVHGTTIPLSRTHARQSSAPYMLSPLRRTTELYPDLAWSMPYTTTCNTWTVPLLSPTSAVSTDLFYSNEWARNGLLDSSLASLIYPSPISLTAPVVPQSFTSTSAPAITTVVAHTDIPEPLPCHLDVTLTTAELAEWVYTRTADLGETDRFAQGSLHTTLGRTLSASNYPSDTGLSAMLYSPLSPLNHPEQDLHIQSDHGHIRAYKVSHATLPPSSKPIDSLSSTTVPEPPPSRPGQSFTGKGMPRSVSNMLELDMHLLDTSCLQFDDLPLLSAGCLSASVV